MCFYLARLYPEFLLRNQNTIYSVPQKFFDNFESTFQSSLNSASDNKELTPEFYTGNPEVLITTRKMELNDNEAIQNVELPEWSRDPQHFAQVMRESLEADYVSENLHNWIDLVFGCQQETNKFSKECSGVDWSTMRNKSEQEAYLVLVSQFGINPDKVFSKPHPQRSFRNKLSLIKELEMTEGVYELEESILQLQFKIETLIQAQSKELVAQRKQYSQLLNQQNFKNQKEIDTLKAQLQNCHEETLVLKNEFEEHEREQEKYYKNLIYSYKAKAPKKYSPNTETTKKVSRHSKTQKNLNSLFLLSKRALKKSEEVTPERSRPVTSLGLLK